MATLMLPPDPAHALLWWSYGFLLVTCVCGSLFSSRSKRHVQATVLATFVWAGAALPIAAWASSLPGATNAVSFPLVALLAVGLFLVRDALRNKAIVDASALA